MKGREGGCNGLRGFEGLQASLLKLGRECACVAQGVALHGGAHGLLERSQAFGVVGKCHGLFHIRAPVIDDQIGQPHVIQDGAPHAAEQGSSRQTDHRHAHVHRKRSCGSPVEGEGVENQVNIVVRSEELLAAQRGLQIHPIHGKARCIQLALPMLLNERRHKGNGAQQQAAVWHTRHHLAPGIQALIGDFRQVTDAGQGDMPLTNHRRVIGQWGGLHGVKAPERGGQHQQAFAVIGLSLGRVDIAVSQLEINGVQAGGGRVAQRRDLHTRQPLGEQIDAVDRCMPRQLHQHIEVLFTDEVLKLPVAQSVHVVKMIGLRFKIIGVFVVGKDVVQ